MPSDTKNVKVGVAKVTFDGVDLGFTKGGVEVEVTTETFKVMVDQFGNSEINEYVNGRTVVARCPLAETTLANLVQIMPGATLTETGGTQATGTIDMGTTNPAEDDTLTINGVKYTFKAAPSGDFEIDIGVDVATTLDNIQAKLAAATAPSVARATYTDNATDTLTITFNEKSVDGNAFTLAANVTGTPWTLSGATLSGGVDSKKRIDTTNGVGSDLLTVAKKLVLHPIGLADSDVSEDFIIPLAATGGNLQFAYKLDEERIFNVEFTGYPNADTKLLFQVGDETA